MENTLGMQSNDPAEKTKQWHFFISHASEDKEEIARPLADRLNSRGLMVWYVDFYRSFRFVVALIQFGARTTWRECREESTGAPRGIFHTVVNRAAKAGWWGTDVVSVILKPFQFSSFNLDDPRRCKPRMK